MPLDLLTENLLPVRRGGVVSYLSLPALYVQLQEDAPLSFPGLQAHQEHPWYALLVQLAVLALDRDAQRDDPSEAAWARRLAALAPEAPTAFSLVSTQDQAAFLQPPDPTGTAGTWRTLRTPDELDLLVNAKNHDVKAARIRHPGVHHWLYALVSLQTMQGFSGRGNYGVVRMNGGFGNRPVFARDRSARWGQRWADDVQQWRATQASDPGYLERDALGWIEPWDGTRSRPIDELDPAFVEVCRRVRLLDRAGQIVVAYAPSTAARVSGVPGGFPDHWTPVEHDAGSQNILTLGGGGLGYARLSQVLFGGVTEAPAMDRRKQGTRFYASALVRGQGKTEGFHERIVPVPGPLRRRVDDETYRRNVLGARARLMITHAGTVRNKVLRPALRNLLDAGKSGGRLDSRPDRWTDALESAIDQRFFPALWEYAEISEDEAQQRWITELKVLARAQLDDAIGACPLPSARRYKAIAAAEQVFGGAFHNQFNALLPAGALPSEAAPAEASPPGDPS